MGESIDKQTVIDLIQILTFSRCMEYGEYVGKEYLVSSDILINAIKELPPAEPERKTGKWIKHKYAEEADGMLIDNYVCSSCHTWERKYSNFCPDCGAKMEGLKTNE